MAGAFLPLAASLVVFAMARHLQVRARRQYRWQPLPGVIVVSSVGFGSDYFPDVQFRYECGGRRYLDLQVRSHAFLGNWFGAARRVVDKYPVGAAVIVYAEPGKPANAVLEPGGDRRFFLFMYGFATLCLVLGLRALVA